MNIIKVNRFGISRHIEYDIEATPNGAKPTWVKVIYTHLKNKLLYIVEPHLTHLEELNGNVFIDGKMEIKPSGRESGAL